jgi:metallo-beta-lactamase family protein
VAVLNGYSAHADRTELHRWLSAVRLGGAASGRASPPVYLVHGEPEAQTAFAAQLRTDGFTVEIPHPGTLVRW